MGFTYVGGRLKVCGLGKVRLGMGRACQSKILLNTDSVKNWCKNPNFGAMRWVLEDMPLHHHTNKL